MFPKHSAFEDDRLDREAASQRARDAALRTPPEPARLEDPTHKESSHGSLEHWHHDLHTVDILLDQDPPDIERARRLVDEIRREMYSELR